MDRYYFTIIMLPSDIFLPYIYIYSKNIYIYIQLIRICTQRPVFQLNNIQWHSFIQKYTNIKQNLDIQKNLQCKRNGAAQYLGFFFFCWEEQVRYYGCWFVRRTHSIYCIHAIGIGGRFESNGPKSNVTRSRKKNGVD